MAHRKHLKISCYDYFFSILSAINILLCVWSSSCQYTVFSFVKKKEKTLTLYPYLF